MGLTVGTDVGATCMLLGVRVTLRTSGDSGIIGGVVDGVGTLETGVVIGEGQGGEYIGTW